VICCLSDIVIYHQTMHDQRSNKFSPMQIQGNNMTIRGEYTLHRISIFYNISIILHSTSSKTKAQSLFSYF
jgi:hypothetical protein